MYNWRYHIASLVAVFLSLSIGLVLGTIVNERGALDAQRDSLINSLQKEFESLSSENRTLTEVHERDAAFIEDTLGHLVADELEGRAVYVLASTGRTDGLAATEDAVRLAGGVPVSITLGSPGFGLSDDGLATALGVFFHGVDREDLLESVAASLSAEWSLPAGQRVVTAALINAGVLNAESLVDAPPIAGLVLLAVAEDSADTAALSLGLAVSRGGIPVVGAQTTSRDTGVAQAAAGAGLSSVDDIDEPQGVFSLVRILAGGVSGQFGVGTGSRPYPR